MTDEHAKNFSCLVTLAIWVGIGFAAWWVGFTLFSTLVLSISIVFVAWLLGKKSPAGLLNELLTMTILAWWVYLVLLLCLLVSCASMFKPSMHLPVESWRSAQGELVTKVLSMLPPIIPGKRICTTFLNAVPTPIFWLMVIASPPYIVARLLRPKRYACFLKARSLYYSYRNKHAQTGSSPRIALPTSNSQQHAAADRRLKKALSLFQQAVRLSQKQGEVYDVVIGEYHMGLILILQGQFQGAKACFGRCQALSSSVRQDVNMVNTLKECAYYISVLP